jgi:ribosomal protein S18 acetylase RimI-like enzyme
VDVLDSACRDPRLLDVAAQIWAEATTTRDGHDQIPALDVSRPVIQGVLDRSPLAFLLIARAADGTAAGFAAIEPVAGSSETIAQVSYIGVRPGLWGQGIGEELLLEALRRLKAAGYALATVMTLEVRAAAERRQDVALPGPAGPGST